MVNPAASGKNLEAAGQLKEWMIFQKSLRPATADGRMAIP